MWAYVDNIAFQFASQASKLCFGHGQRTRKRETIAAVVESYGIYEGWTGAVGAVPKVTGLTDTVPAIIGIGYVLRIRGAKGILLIGASSIRP